MPSPFILVNLKTFKEGMGNRAHMIANAAQLVAHESGVTIAIAPSYVDLHPLCHHFAIPVYAQHVDGFEPGAHTGHITADAIRMAGAAGSLINHSERRLGLAEIEASVRALQVQKLISVVCSNNESTSAGAAALAPEYVAIEPPELIGSGVSVSKANPDIIRRSVAAVRGGHDDWRLPTIAELASLYDDAFAWPVTCGESPTDVHIDPLFQLTCLLYWSSSTDGCDPGWHVI